MGAKHEHWITRRGNGPHGTRPGDRLKSSAEILEFVAARSRDVDGGCIEWVGSISKQHGYGLIAIGKRISPSGRPYAIQRLAHRVVWELLNGNTTLALDHLCLNKLCVNPAHLEPISIGENVRRYFAYVVEHGTHCRRGHEYTDESTEWRKGADGEPRRVCRVCSAHYQQLWREGHFKPKAA